MDAKRVRIYVGGKLLLNAAGLKYKDEKSIRLNGMTFKGTIGKVILQSSDGKEVKAFSQDGEHGLEIQIDVL